MSKAYKCERCGTFHEGRSKTRIAFTSYSGIFNIASDIELCPTCFDKVKAFVANDYKEEVHIKSTELCDRCQFGYEQFCKNLKHGECSGCPMYTEGRSDGKRCECNLINYGEPCPYFKEAK